MKVSVFNPTMYRRHQYVIVGTEEAPDVGVPFLELPRSKLNVVKVLVPEYFSGEVDVDEEDYNIPFAFHPDLIAGLNAGFYPYISLNGVEYSFVPIRNFVQHERLVVSLFRARLNNGVANLYTYTFHDSPIVKYELTFNLESTMQPAMPVNLRMGITGSSLVLNVMRYGNPQQLINMSLDDTQGRMWMGSFCFYGAETFNNMETASTLAAEIAYPLYAVSRWQNWGAFKHPTLNLNDNDVKLEYFSRAGKPYWETLGHFDVIGAKESRTTGDQGGFGPWQNFMTSSSYNAALMYLDALATNQEYCRPVRYFEADGEMVKSQDHSRWVTWDERTHFSTGVSPDRLFRNHNMSMSNLWSGYDRQHDSSTCIANQVILNGSFASMDWIRAKIESYLAGETIPSMKPGWSTNDIEGGGRGMGRPFVSYVYCWMATGDTRILDRAARRVIECLKPYYDMINRNLTGEMRVLRVITGDQRVFGGQPGWVVWEDAIGLMGMEALLIALKETGISQQAQTILDDIIWSVGKTYTMHGFMKDRVQAVYLYRWDGTGVPIPASEYNDPAKIQPGDGTDVKSWGLPALSATKKRAIERNEPAIAAEAQRLISAILQPNRPYERTYVGGGI